jgi:23S rRNA (adenine2503-C2)-methyltransferase
MDCEQNLPHILSLSPDELSNWFFVLYGKGKAHAENYLKSIYQKGTDLLTSIPEFRIKDELIRSIQNDFPLKLPVIIGMQTSNFASKIVFKMMDGCTCEAVYVKMSRFKTLCISSQAGCRFACTFCETGKTGFKHSLKTEEIVGQVMAVLFELRKQIDHIVFMGMGEPLDNIDAVIKAIDILALRPGLSFPMSSICISTAGHVPGILKLAGLFQTERGKGYYRLRLAVSLNTANDELRSKLMPINRKYPLGELKKALIRLSAYQQEKALFFEYVLLPGINNSPHQIGELIQFCEGLPVSVNIIPYNPGSSPITRPPVKEEIDAVFDALASRGIQCRVRHSKGKEIMAGCGQLGGGIKK